MAAKQQPQAERKPLTTAQRNHFKLLTQRANTAQAAVQDYVNYLAEEHECSGNGWQITATEFVRQVPEPDGE